jgi:hypothetical protein
MNGSPLGQIFDRMDFHSCCVILESFIHPIVVAVENDSAEIAGRPLLGSLLNELKNIPTVFIVSKKMHAVDYDYKRSSHPFSPLDGHLIQLVEGTFDIK